jgi:hypothetical protein
MTHGLVKSADQSYTRPSLAQGAKGVRLKGSRARRIPWSRDARVSFLQLIQATNPEAGSDSLQPLDMRFGTPPSDRPCLLTRKDSFRHSVGPFSAVHYRGLTRGGRLRFQTRSAVVAATSLLVGAHGAESRPRRTIDSSSTE